MTIDEVAREMTRTKARLSELKSELRFLRQIDRLRSGKTIASLVYQLLEALPIESPARTPTQIMECLNREGVPHTTQYYAVESSLRSMRSTGAVTKIGWGMYAATSRLGQTEKSLAANV